jgi:hypothetical protein
MIILQRKKMLLLKKIKLLFPLSVAVSICEGTDGTLRCTLGTIKVVCFLFKLKQYFYKI